MVAMRRSRPLAKSFLAFALPLLLATLLLVGAAPAAVAEQPQGSPGALPALVALQQAKLTAPDGAALDWFGFSVALDGDTAVVGACWDDLGTNTDQGSAYVFVRSGTSWTLQQKLTASDGAAGDNFGSSVALSGDTALVGALGDDVGAGADQGSAYVFVRSGTGWALQQKLTASGGAAGDNFGVSVGLEGDTALIGAWNDDVGANDWQGSATVFVRSGTTWSEQAYLTASDAAAGDFFGSSVALSGDTALVGAYRHDVGADSDQNQGAAYVFARSGSTWTQQGQLMASDGARYDNFGTSVALNGDTALIAAPAHVLVAGGNKGSTYVFVRSGSIWGEQQQLTASDAAADEGFGSSVALDGDTALVGASMGALSHQGAAYVFVRSGGTWSQQAQLTAADGGNWDHFGSSVALDGDSALVGAYYDSIGSNQYQGSAYVFGPVPPTTTATVSPAANAAGWNETTVTVTLSATDADSAVASTEYRAVGAGDWSTYAAPFDVSARGTTTWEYRSTDVDGHIEVPERLTIRIDPTRPVTRALANASVVRYRRVTLRLRVDDAVSPRATVTVKFFYRGLLRKTLPLGLRATNTEIRYRYLCKLARGTYTWKVYAVDRAGNRQSKVGYKTLGVR